MTAQMLFFNLFSAKDPHLNAVENVFPTVISGRNVFSTVITSGNVFPTVISGGNALRMHLNKWHVLRQQGDSARKPDAF